MSIVHSGLVLGLLVRDRPVPGREEGIDAT